MNYFAILILCVIMNLVTITVGFSLGIKLGKTNNENVKINEIKKSNEKISSKNNFEVKETKMFEEKEDNSIEILMHNIENYDGTSNGQKGVK